jgi:hypothetical protein
MIAATRRRRAVRSCSVSTEHDGSLDPRFARSASASREWIRSKRAHRHPQFMPPTSA